MEKTIPQLDITYYQIKPSLPVAGTTFCVGQMASIDNSKTLQNTANTINYPLQPYGKIILLITPYTYVTKLGEIDLMFNLKLDPY